MTDKEVQKLNRKELLEFLLDAQTENESLQKDRAELRRQLRQVEEENLRPACIVGIPVGFVGAADSKAELAKQETVPFITVEGTKGGSPIAAAAVNAMMYLINNDRG